jgi:hypothetical protein
MEYAWRDWGETRNSLIWIICVPAENRILHLQNISHDRYHYSNLLDGGLPWKNFSSLDIQIISFFHVHPKFNSVRKIRPLTLSWAHSIQSILSHNVSIRYILILSSHLCLDLPNGLFLQIFWQKHCTHFPFRSLVLHVPLTSSSFVWSSR